MEIVILALEFIGFMGLLFYTRQAHLYGERGTHHLQWPIFGVIGMTVLILSSIQILSDLMRTTVILDSWMILDMVLFVIMIVAVWTATFVAIVSSKRAGAVLLNLGNDSRIPWWVLGVIAVGSVALSYHYLNAEGAYYKTLTMFSVIAFWVFTNTKPVRVTERGFYGLDKIAGWQSIQAHAWSMRNDNQAVLVLNLKRRWPIFAKATVYVPAKNKEAVEQLLFQHRTAQHGAECVKQLRQQMLEFRVESNGLNRAAWLLSGSKAVDLWTTLRLAPSCPQGPQPGRRRAGSSDAAG